MSRFRTWLIGVLFVTVLGVSQFVLCVFYSMHKFPGGYSLALNYLSDLGRSGASYKWLFNGSLIVLGVSLIPLFLTMTLLERRQNAISMKIATGLGVLSALGIVGMGLLPIDRSFILHHVALGVWLFPMIYMTIVFFYAAARQPHVGAGFIAAALITAIGMIVFFATSDYSNQIKIQKAIVVCSLIWLAFIFWFVFQTGILILRNERLDGEIENREKRESEYLTDLLRQRAQRHRH